MTDKQNNFNKSSNYFNVVIKEEIELPDLHLDENGEMDFFRVKTELLEEAKGNEEEPSFPVEPAVAHFSIRPCFVTLHRYIDLEDLSSCGVCKNLKNAAERTKEKLLGISNSLNFEGNEKCTPRSGIVLTKGEPNILNTQKELPCLRVENLKNGTGSGTQILKRLHRKIYPRKVNSRSHSSNHLEDNRPRLHQENPDSVNSHVDFKKEKYQCKKCQKNFTPKCNIQRHLRIHSGEKPFKCSECPIGFARKDHLKMHMQIHLGEKLFKCSECQRGFARKYDLKMHLRLHLGERPYECNQCHKRFVRKSDLKSHIMRIHSEEKPLKCSECPKGFVRKYDLKMHLRIHSGERPYKCNECQNEFAEKSVLKVHIMKIHSEVKL